MVHYSTWRNAFSILLASIVLGLWGAFSPAYAQLVDSTAVTYNEDFAPAFEEDEEGVSLSWSTETEESTTGFVVQRVTDESDFVSKDDSSNFVSSLISVSEPGSSPTQIITAQGNPSTGFEYEVFDGGILLDDGTTYYYRLFEVDAGNKFIELDTKSVRIGSASEEATETPTPTNTPESTSTPTETPVPEPTETETPVPTGTAEPTSTPTPTPTATPTPTPTSTATDEPVDEEESEDESPAVTDEEEPAPPDPEPDEEEEAPTNTPTTTSTPEPEDETESAEEVDEETEEEPTDPEPSSTPTATPTLATSTPTLTPTPSLTPRPDATDVPEPTETSEETSTPQPISTEAAEVEPEEVEPVEVEPTEVEPVEVEPAEVEPAEVEPAEVEPAEVEPAEVEPAEVEPDEVEPAEVEPDEVEPDEVEPDEVEPDEVEPDEVEPDEVEPDEVEPVEVEPAEVEPVEVEPAEVEPVEVEPVEVEPVEVEPVEVEPAEVEPVEVEPVEAEPVEVDDPVSQEAEEAQILEELAQLASTEAAEAAESYPVEPTATIPPTSTPIVITNPPDEPEPTAPIPTPTGGDTTESSTEVIITANQSTPNDVPNSVPRFRLVGENVTATPTTVPTDQEVAVFQRTTQSRTNEYELPLPDRSAANGAERDRSGLIWLGLITSLLMFALGLAGLVWLLRSAERTVRNPVIQPNRPTRTPRPLPQQPEPAAETVSFTRPDTSSESESTTFTPPFRTEPLRQDEQETVLFQPVTVKPMREPLLDIPDEVVEAAKSLTDSTKE